MEQIKVLIVDDNEVVREGLKSILDPQVDINVVGEAVDGLDAIAKAEKLSPDVILMDAHMPGMDGTEATRRIKEANPSTAVLALTMHEDEQYFFEMLQAGASGYVPKRAAPDDLVSAIRVVSQGNVFLYPTLAELLVKDYLQRAESDPGSAAKDLTPREREVLTYIAEGYTNREIAEELVISVKTVDRHRENIMRKLNLHNRVELVKYAFEKGLITVK